MIIGIVGKKQSGKDTVCNIIRYISWLKSSKLWGEVTLNAKHFEAVCESEDIAPILSVWEKHPWAEKLKQCASIILGCHVSSFETESIKESFTHIPISNSEGEPMTHREFLQVLGTEVGRTIDPNLWVKSMMSDYDKGFKSYPTYGTDEYRNTAFVHMNTVEPCWIMPDTRFLNEVQAIKDRKGIVIKVNRDTGLLDNHISEHALDDYNDYDYVIDNNGTLGELIVKVATMMETLGVLQ